MHLLWTNFDLSVKSQDSIFGGSPTRELDASIEGPPLAPPSVKKGAAPKSEPHPLSKSETAADSGAEKSTTDDDTTSRKPGVFHASDNKEQQKQPTEYKIEETQGNFSYYLWIHLLMAVKHVSIVSIDIMNG